MNPIHEFTNFPASFVGKSGQFYVRVPRSTGGFTQRCAVYSSTDAYDKRTELPYYTGVNEVAADFAQEVRIYPQTLTTTPPPAEAWEKEAEMMEKARIENSFLVDFWARMRSAREGYRYAA